VYKILKYYEISNKSVSRVQPLSPKEALKVLLGEHNKEEDQEEKEEKLHKRNGSPNRTHSASSPLEHTRLNIIYLKPQEFL